MSGLSTQEIERSLKTWMRFVTPNSALLWRAAHKSSVEFLSRKLDLEAAHRQIGRFFNVPARWKTPYASRHLSTHLQYDPEGLFRLIRDRRWQRAQDAGDVTSVAYMGDLRRAWRLAERLNEDAVAAGRETPYLAEEAWCAVRFREVSRVVPQFIFSNLSTFLKSDLMPISSALSLLDKAPGDLTSSLEALWRLLKLDGNSHRVFNQLFEFVRGLRQENVRWQGLRDLIEYAPGERVADFFEASFGITEMRSELELVSTLIAGECQVLWPIQFRFCLILRLDSSVARSIH
jgi:hypothetical protein